MIAAYDSFGLRRILQAGGLLVAGTISLSGCQMVKHNTSIHSVSFDWNTYRQVSFWCEERDHLPLRSNRVAMTQWAYNAGGRMPQGWAGAATCPPENSLVGPANPPSSAYSPDREASEGQPGVGTDSSSAIPPGPAQPKSRSLQELPAPPGWGGVPDASTQPRVGDPQGLPGPTQPDLLDNAAPPSLNSSPGNLPGSSRTLDQSGPTAAVNEAGIQRAGYFVEPSQRRVVQKTPSSKRWIFTN